METDSGITERIKQLKIELKHLEYSTMENAACLEGRLVPLRAKITELYSLHFADKRRKHIAELEARKATLSQEAIRLRKSQEEKDFKNGENREIEFLSGFLGEEGESNFFVCPYDRGEELGHSFAAMFGVNLEAYLLSCKELLSKKDFVVKEGKIVEKRVFQYGDQLDKRILEFAKLVEQ